MNPTEPSTPCGDDHRFDLLADGELSPAERRELLAGLDDEPGGWRQCALAFLEAQALKQDLGSMLPERAAAKQPAGRSRSSGYRGTLLATAASFLVALFLGTQLSQLWHAPAATGPMPAELAKGESKAPEPSPQPVPRPERPKEMLVDTPGSGPSQSPSAKVWMVELAEPNGKSEPIRVPATERDEIDAQWLRNLPAAIPPEIVRHWERLGRPVRQHRRLVPFRLDDGRQLVVPVDDVNIHYVGRPAL